MFAPFDVCVFITPSVVWVLTTPFFVIVCAFDLRHLSVQAPVFTIGLVLVEASGFINGCVICCLDQKMFCSCRNLAEI